MRVGALTFDRHTDGVTAGVHPLSEATPAARRLRVGRLLPPVAIFVTVYFAVLVYPPLRPADLLLPRGVPARSSSSCSLPDPSSGARVRVPDRLRGAHSRRSR